MKRIRKLKWKKKFIWELLFEIAHQDVSWVTKGRTRDHTKIFVLIDFLFDLFSEHHNEFQAVLVKNKSYAQS